MFALEECASELSSALSGADWKMRARDAPDESRPGFSSLRTSSPYSIVGALLYLLTEECVLIQGLLSYILPGNN